MGIEFTNHNIRLDDGTETKPEIGYSMETYPRFLAARRIIETVLPGDKSGLRIVDLGCLEGGYTVEFARMGFQSLGIEIREANLAACNYVKSKVDLPNLTFKQDDAWNIGNYGVFDIVFCCGLYYHFDEPKRFLETVSAATKKMVILQTHFSTDREYPKSNKPDWLRKILGREELPTDKFNLSELCENEGLMGRWYTEFQDSQAHDKRDTAKWSSWDNRRSFWVQREYLLQALRDAGFDLVLEQYDGLGENIAASMLGGVYKEDRRGTFIGIKTGL